jgi:hypothetical protein
MPLPLSFLIPFALVATTAQSESGARTFRQEAEGACRAGDFSEFLFYLAGSREGVRFAASRVRVTRGGRAREIPRSAWRGFAIATTDWYYVAADSQPGAPDYLDVQTREIRPGTWRVDWVRARFDGSSEGDSLGNVVETYGPRGHYLFSRVGNCWQVTDDVLEAETTRRR